jgi:protein-S-isoprenylcysteine O-methyltransferase Ste14
MAEKAKRPPLARSLILAAASALVIMLALGAFWLDARLNLRLPDGLRWPGMAVLACGLALIAWAEATLLRLTRSSGGFGDTPATLVAEGPCRRVRNPIYVGAFGVLLGLSWWRASPTLFVVVLVFLPAMHVFITRVEEPATRARLGAAYDDCLGRVPRWFPRLRRPGGD